MMNGHTNGISRDNSDRQHLAGMGHCTGHSSIHLNLGNLDQHGRIMAEYVWPGGDGPLDLRSKTRVLDLPANENDGLPAAEDLPRWNFDGSSTGQARTEDSDVILVPRAVFCDPFRGSRNIIVLCDCHMWCDGSLQPIDSNTREPARHIFAQCPDEKPLFGMEQEYCIIDRTTGLLLDGSSCPMHESNQVNGNGLSVRVDQRAHYCGNGLNISLGRNIAETHARLCLHAGVRLSGINAEVLSSQWEFQVGPCEGIDIGDHMVCARYLLLRVAEAYHVDISFDPKPVEGHNGSGCHCNFSTEKMRQDGGLKHILDAIERLADKHDEHLAAYGEGNERRLVGMYETASMDKFTWGFGDRSASVRVGWDTKVDGKGYLEDRRPASNCDPYVVSSLLVKTVCL